MKVFVRIIAGLVLSAVFVWLSLRGQSLSEVASALGTADARWLAFYFVVLSVIHVVRTIRWGLLLQPLARIDFRSLNPIAAVGFMALMVMPLRLGEFARPVLVAERLRVRKSAAFASVVVERVVDGLAVGLLLVLLLWMLGPRATGENIATIRVGGALVTGVFAAGLAVLMLAYRSRETTVRLVRRWFGRLSPKFADRVAEMLSSFSEGLQVVPTAGKLVQFLLLTALFWGLNAAGLWVAAQAFGIPIGMTESLTVLGLQVIGVMIPAGPGMVGPFQFFTALGLGLFLHGEGSGALAAAYAHTVWVMQFGQQVLFGLTAVGTGRVSLGSLARLREETDTQVASSP